MKALLPTMLALAAGASLPTLLPAQQPSLPAGVTVEVAEAVHRGREWLSRSQAADGSWRADGASAANPTALTGLAGMAMLAGGSTPTRGRHWREVRRAVDFLLRHANADSGLLATHGADSSQMHGHGFATLFLASVYGMEEDARAQARLRAALDRAVALIAGAQSPAGGWYYTADSNTDEGSVTVTQIQALRACRMSGIVVDKRVVDRAVGYVRACQNPDGGLLYRLGSGGVSRPAITAAGVAVLYNAGVYDDEEFVASAYAYCRHNLSPGRNDNGHDFYAWYYWSQSVWQRGGREWDELYTRITKRLLSSQNGDGSWNGDGVGRCYGTAVATTILQLPWALVPIYQR